MYYFILSDYTANIQSAAGNPRMEGGKKGLTGGRGVDGRDGWERDEVGAYVMGK